MNEKTLKVSPVIVCSDKKAGKGAEEDDISVMDIGYPVTTDSKELQEKISLSLSYSHATVVFSTYQSLSCVIDAQNSLPAFNLVIADEAHKTAGVNDYASSDRNMRLIHEGGLKAEKTLFMTATPQGLCSG